MTPFAPLIIALLAASLSPPGQRAAPSAEIPLGQRRELRPTLGELVLASPSAHHDAGTVFAGEPAEHRFEFRVEGGPVRVLKLRPSASCTIPPLLVRFKDRTQSAPHTLGQPLAEGTILELTARMATNAARGPRTVSAWIDWAPLGPGAGDEPAVRSQRVRVTAQVKPLFFVDPPFHSLGDIPLGESRTVKSVIRSSMAGPFRLERLEGTRADDSRVATWLRPLHAGQDGRSTHWQLSLRVDGSTKVGAGGAVARAQLMDADAGDLIAPPEVRSLAVTIGFRVVGPFLFAEDFTSFGLFAPETTVDRILELTVPDQGFDPGRMSLRIESDPERDSDERILKALKKVTCDVLTPAAKEKAGKRPGSSRSAGPGPLRIRLRVDELPPELAGVLRGRLVVKTGDPVHPEVIARFSGVCRVVGASNLASSRGR